MNSTGYQGYIRPVIVFSTTERKVSKKLIQPHPFYKNVVPVKAREKNELNNE
jgi:hypothetical protein